MEAHSEDSPPFKCNVCQANFSRHEHLLRHGRSHTREKPYRCEICEKRFARMDVLSRHVSSHQQSVPNTLPMFRRACKQCAASRVRCSKERKCQRCVERGLSCIYPTNKGERRGSGEQADLQSGDNSEQTRTNASTSCNVGEVGSQDLWSSIYLGNNQGKRNEHNISKPPELGNIAMIEGVGPWINAMDAAQFAQPLRIECVQEYAVQAPISNLSLGASGINWLSPEYSGAFDWEASGPQLLQATDEGAVVGGPYTSVDTNPVTMQNFPDQCSLEQQELVTRNDTSDRTSHMAATNKDQTAAASVSIDGTHTSDVTEGTLYVEGTGARAPFRGRHIFEQEATPSSIDDDFANYHPTSSEMESGEGRHQESDEDYYVSSNAYYRLKQEAESSPWFSGEEAQASFPSLTHFRWFTRLYFERFSPNFPFIRKSPTIFHKQETWVLLFAVATLGTRYTREREMRRNMLRLLHSMMEHRVAKLSTTRDHDETQSELDLTILQAGILHIICMVHLDTGEFIDYVLVERYHLVEACRKMRLLDPEEPFPAAQTQGNPQDKVSAWVVAQARLRTGMMIWLLDSILSNELRCPHLLELRDARLPLPAAEDLWTYPTADRLSDKRSETVTISDALEMLYMEKRLPPNLGEFSNTLLIYAICRRMKEVVHHHQPGLSSWTPNPAVQTRHALPHRSAQSWPPSNPIVSKWRNSTCDSLDILHWVANSVAARAGGWEHPTILHLHLSRLLLLTPIETIMKISRDPSFLFNTTEKSLSRENCRLFRQWVTLDQFKARLAIIHAGALLWHIRRYSSGCFIEPFAIYIASLVLWSFSFFSQPSLDIFKEVEGTVRRGVRTDMSGRNSFSPSSGSVAPGSIGQDLLEPNFIHLDRPCDDELVQMYVRFGHRMKGYLFRVGDIMSNDAPQRILQEGVRVLANTPLDTADKLQMGLLSNQNRKSGYSSGWGIERSYVDLLEGLYKETNLDNDHAQREMSFV